MLKMLVLALRAQFTVNAPLPPAQIVHVNEPTKTIAEDKPWIRFSVLPGASKPIGTGDNPPHRILGRVQMSVFVPVRKGDAPAYDLADQCEAIFRDWSWVMGDNLLTIDGFERTILPEEKWYSIKISALWTATVQPE